MNVGAGFNNNKKTYLALVVDDDPAIRHIIMLLLQVLGLEVDLAEDGLSAVRHFQSRRYDLVLMDIQMPNMNGLQAAAAMRTIETNAQQSTQIPIIAVTAGGASETACLAVGMSDFVDKPLCSNKLERLLSRWLNFDPAPAS